MKYLGIDPSSIDHNGVVVWDDDTETIVYKNWCDGETVVQIMRYSLSPFTEAPFDQVWCETMQHMGMEVGADVFNTCFWIGEYRRVAKDLGLTFNMVTRTSIKIHHCRTNKAKDPNVRRAIIERYGYWEHGKTGLGLKKHPGKLFGVKEDMWSGLAIALYAADQEKERRLNQ